MISGLNHTALVHPVYASSNALPHSHARLGSGCWLGFTGRVSNPLNSCKWFPPASASPTTRFMLALSQYIRNPHGPACPPPQPHPDVGPSPTTARTAASSAFQPQPGNQSASSVLQKDRILPASLCTRQVHFGKLFFTRSLPQFCRGPTAGVAGRPTERKGWWQILCQLQP